MNGLLLDHGAALLVCDGRKALFLVNTGQPGRERFQVEHELEEDHPATHDLGTDRPGLLRQTAAGQPGSAIEGTDRHAREEERFLQRAVGAFDAFVLQRKASQVVLVAPPRALAVLRRTASPGLLRRTVFQIGKDLTKHPVADLARVLLA